MLKEYLKSQNRTNEEIIANTFSSDEAIRFSKSDYRWADNKRKPFRHMPVRKGEIYQFEFGKNYIPEMSYEHRGIVIGVKQKLLYVLPIFSYDADKHVDVYHPVDYPDSKSDMFLLKNSEFSFIKHHSVLKLNDIRTVSVNRILYQHSGRIAPSSDTYKKIERLVMLKYFPEFCHDFEQKTQMSIVLQKRLDEAEEEKNILRMENGKLMDELKALKERLSALEDNESRK